MDFTIDSYKRMIDTLQQKRYTFSLYIDDEVFEKQRNVIMRHDVDFSIDRALQMAQIEKSMGIKSTFFFLLFTEFYNVASKESQDKVNEIISMGHDVGLHFDEVSYSYKNFSQEKIEKDIKIEVTQLSNLLRHDICAVSMHRPSGNCLESNLNLAGLINAYDKRFLGDIYKYLSDSRMSWRENVDLIIEEESYDRINILTHPIWYNDEKQEIGDCLKRFIKMGNYDRYNALNTNLRDLKDIFTLKELCEEGVL